MAPAPQELEILSLVRAVAAAELLTLADPLAARAPDFGGVDRREEEELLTDEDALLIPPPILKEDGFFKRGLPFALTPDEGPGLEEEVAADEEGADVAARELLSGVAAVAELLVLDPGAHGDSH